MKISAAIAATLALSGGLLVVSEPADAVNLRMTVLRSPDGVLDTKYPCKVADHSDCRPPNSLAMSFGVIPNQDIVSGTPYSKLPCSLYLTGTNAAVSVCSSLGCTLPSGWTATPAGFASFSLAYSGTGTGGATGCKIQAVASGETATSLPFSVSATAAGATDALAGTTPTNCFGTGVINAINWTCDASTDNHDGTNNGSGIKDYCYQLNGAADVCINDTAPGYIAASTQQLLGAPATGSTTDSAGTITLTCSGVGLGGTSKQICMRKKTVTGAFTMTVQIVNVTGSPQDVSLSGLIASPSLSTANEVAETFYQFSGAGQSNKGTRAKAVNTAGVAPVTIATCTGDGATFYKIRMERVNPTAANETWKYATSTDGTSYTPCAEHVHVMPLTLDVGVFNSSTVDGTPMTSTFNQWSVANRTGPTFTQSVSNSSPNTLKWRNHDLAAVPNVSPYSVVTSASGIITGAVAKRWRPGIQIELEPWVVNGGAASWTTALFDEFAAMNSPVVKANAIVLKVQWGAIETSRGVYDFTQIDAAKAAAHARGFKLALLISHWAQSQGSVAFQTASAAAGGAGREPAYLATDSDFTALAQDTGTTCPAQTASHCTKGGYYAQPNVSVVMPRLWLPGPMDRLIALYAALGARYDNDNDIEIIRDYTTSILLLPEAWGGDPLYNHGNMTTQLQRLISGMEAAFPHTNFTVGLDYYGSDADVAGVLTYMSAHHAMLSSTDICLKHEINLQGSQGMRIYRGAVGGHDYRTTNGGILGMGAAFEIEGRTMEIPACVPVGTDMSTVLTVIHGKGVLYPNNHEAVAYVGNSEVKATKPAWSVSSSGTQQIKSFISTGPTVGGTCPGNYDGGCNTTP